MATSSLQIEQYYSGNPLWGGCWMRDQLKGKKPAGKFYILNVDESKNPGTHWVLAVFFLPMPLYMDPFGISAPPEIAEFMSKGRKDKQFEYSAEQYQDILSDKCALFCIECANELLEHRDADMMDHEMTDVPSQHNEDLVGQVKLMEFRR